MTGVQTCALPIYLILLGGFLGVIGVCYLLKDTKEGRFEPVLYLPEGEGVAGAKLVGEIRLRTPLPTDAKVQLSLSCNHFDYSGDEMPRKEVLWKRTKETLSDRGTSIIVGFDLAEVCIASRTNPEISQDIQWHLEACAVNTKFKVRFVVPIAKQTDYESDDLRRQ